MNYLIAAIAVSAVFIVSAGKGLCQGQEQSPLENDDSDYDWDSGDNDSPSDLDETHGSRRERARSAILGNFGEGPAWNSFGLRVMNWQSPQHAWSMHAGVGKFHEVSDFGVYDFKTSTTNLGARGQWWPSDHFPIALHGDLNLHRWLVKAGCIEGSSQAVCTEGTWDGWGASAGAGLLLSWLAEKPVIVEWTIVGIRTSKIWRGRWKSEHVTSANHEIESFIGEKMIVGVANISAGYYF